MVLFRIFKTNSFSILKIKQPKRPLQNFHSFFSSFFFFLLSSFLHLSFLFLFIMTSIRRATLGPLSDSQLNHRLSIGASSAARPGVPTAKPRQSLAPNSLLVAPINGSGGAVAQPSMGLASRPSLAGAGAGSSGNAGRPSISMGRPSASRLSISGSQQQQQQAAAV